MALLDTTALAAVLKQIYDQDEVRTLTYSNEDTLFAMIPKDEEFVGKNKQIAMRYATPLGLAPTVADAQSNKTASAWKAFSLTRSSYYGLASITTEAIRAAKGDMGSLVEGLRSEIDGTLISLTRKVAKMLYGNGGGAIGQVSNTSFAVTALTLTQPGDVVNFEVGMTLRVSANDGTTGALRSGSLTVSAVDRTAGTVTMSGNLSTGIAAIAQNDYIFQAPAASTGDFGLWLKGLNGWFPATAPTAGDNWFGVDRSVDVTRLAGLRVSGSGAPMEETIIQAATLIKREGGKLSHVFVNPLDWAKLVQALGTRVQYNRVTAFEKPDIGFKAVEVITPTGTANVVADLNCPQGTGFGVQLDTLKLHTLGAGPGIIDDDGLTIFRSATSDDYEVRCSIMGNLGCEAPGYNANIAW